MSKTLICKVCGDEKPLSEMRKQSSLKLGYQNLCKECRKKHRRENGEYSRKRAYDYAQRTGQKVPLVSGRYIEEISKESCVYCGISLTSAEVVATCDHVYPIGTAPGDKKYGGANIEVNVLPCCRSCNSAKGELFAIEAFDKFPERFKPELLRPFVRRFIGGFNGRELTDIEVEQMIQHLRDEAAEVRRNEAKAVKSNG